MIDPREKKAFMEASPAQREVARQLLRNLLAVLRAQYLSYQTSHWQVVGEAYYGNHLLFQRLYESVQEQIDGLAEKMVGYLGIEAVALSPQIEGIEKFTLQWAKVPCHHRRGLLSERYCQETIKTAYDSIKAAGAMTLGLDDFLMATSNEHDSNQFLLQQALTLPPGKVATLVKQRFAQDSGAESADEIFFASPRKREVREFAETGAISNSPEVAAEAAKKDHLDMSRAKAVAEAKEAPPTPTEIEKMPGGDEVSTLNRYVVQSEDPAIEKAVPMNEARALESSWIQEIEARKKAAFELKYTGPGGVLGWTSAKKQFNIERSSIPRSLNLREGVDILSPRGTVMKFTDPKAVKDREGEVTHWILRGDLGLTLIIWND